MTASEESKRAQRIAMRMCEYHAALDDLYECLTDREFAKAEKNIKFLMSELRITQKALEEDDF